MAIIANVAHWSPGYVIAAVLLAIAALFSLFPFTIVSWVSRLPGVRKLREGNSDFIEGVLLTKDCPLVKSASIGQIVRRLRKARHGLIANILVDELIRRNARDAVGKICTFCEGKDPAVTVAFLNAMEKLGTEHAVPHVERLLGDANREVRMAACRALMVLGAYARSAKLPATLDSDWERKDLQQVFDAWLGLAPEALRAQWNLVPADVCRVFFDPSNFGDIPAEALRRYQPYFDLLTEAQDNLLNRYARTFRMMLQTEDARQAAPGASASWEEIERVSLAITPRVFTCEHSQDVCMNIGPSYFLTLQPGVWSFELESRFHVEDWGPESADIVILTLRTADAHGTVWEFRCSIDATELLWKAFREGPPNARAWWHRANPEWRAAFEKNTLIKGVQVFTDEREARTVAIGDDVVTLYTKYFGAAFNCAVLPGRSAADFCLLVGVTHMLDPDMIAVPPHITCMPLFKLLADIPPFLVNDETKGDFVPGNRYEVNRTTRKAEPQPVCVAGEAEQAPSAVRANP